MKGGKNKMEEQTPLENLEIGTEEASKLEPAKVKIVKTSVETVGDKGAKKLVCEVLHPAKDTPIQISAVKLEKRGKLDVAGLWINLDGQKKIRKGSATALFLQFFGAKTIKDLQDMELMTTEDENGYLVFKAY